MKTPLLLVAGMVAMMVTSSKGQGVDNTVKEGARGAAVVDAVVDRIRSRCIFSDDRLFLRRAAYVTSRDGANTDTYRPGYNGGIWQIDETMFESTRTCPAVISSACNAINGTLGVKWTDVTWSDLRKPLYSGVAAALYTLLQLNGQGMPGNVTEQAEVWATMYGGQADTFTNAASLVTAVDCEDKMDLVFILDSSGSVSPSDFQLMLRFAADVVDVMDVSPDVVRVADVVYSSSVSVQFDFNDYTGKDDLRSKILATYKINGGTNTASGINKTSEILFSTSSAVGARSDAKKVAVLVTDGRSSSLSQTVAAATALKDKGTTVFAVGVGGYRLAELQGVASEPICSHVFTLQDFSVIQSILTEIQKSACEARTVITPDKPDGGDLGTQANEKTSETKVPESHQTLEAVVTCGILDIYVSTTDPKPGPAVYENKYQASDESPAVLTVTDTLPEGTPVYITVVGTRLPESVAQLRNCTDYGWTLGIVEKKNVTVTCAENGVPRPCTKDDIKKAGLCDGEEEVDKPFDNPCTEENLDNGIMRHPYPYDSTKFLQCDLSGNVYVTSCPNGVVFNTESRECGFTAPGGGIGGSVSDTGSDAPDTSGPGGQVNVSSLPSGHANPCTTQALRKREYYHTYTPDKKKFIQCDEWGYAWVKPCSSTTEWSQTDYTCTHTAVSTTPKCNAPGEFLANPCDPATYYQCDSGRIPQKRRCPGGLYFKLSISGCDYDSNPLPSTC
ncbi:hypothetical protein BaRGS_00013024 [Batillaria attramentaria]|uniref:Uncharacterized protein n=1 Tax=Batillaria attramentaria TaxID=370345 RepID=A0ABD0L9J3_9CAEN